MKVLHRATFWLFSLEHTEVNRQNLDQVVQMTFKPSL